ncbi:MAG TPA: low temperature requirement protein A [Micromonosporaceae bacterium]|nr:low temperature requirement protein A [Micromonosporaceae bacterium]HCU48743.1 low temperature requirement protein A [Micromonosporaceae bacterium]
MEPRNEPSPSESPSGQAEQERESVVKVSTLELFFDLVFVFTITQLTGILAQDLTWPTVGRVLLILGIILWMYGGYAWLTNVVTPSDAVRRGLLLSGMGGFLLIALAIPDALHESGWAFGLGYFVVNAIHSGLLLRAAPAAMRQLAPLNLLSASLILVGGFTPGIWRVVLWCAAFLVMVVSPYLHPMSEWTITASHFVERHGLIVIVALGESIVAIGVGAAGLELTGSLIAVALLGLVLSFGLWWLYFGGDDEAAERALDATPSLRRGRVALHAFGFAHYPLLFGIVVLAAGIKKATTYSSGHVYLSQALLLGGGVALFLLADVWFRRVLRIGVLRFRLIGAAAALATVPLGLRFTVEQMLALVLVVGGVLLLEKKSALRSI